MVSLYIYAIVITFTCFILIWVLYKSEDEIRELKKDTLNEAEKLISLCVGCSKYYEDKIKMYEAQIYADTNLINELRKENWNLKNGRE